jgi:isoleucyl-tRNA synthetase
MKGMGTIGRFYTLMVLATALFDKPAFQNLICNGLVLAEDGKKMSKRLKNYPPPTDIIDEYGAVSDYFLDLICRSLSLIS